MGSVISMYSLYKSDQFLPLDISLGLITLLPLIVSGSANTHKCTEVLHIIISGQKLNYFEFLGFKRTYSRSPASFVRTV